MTGPITFDDPNDPNDPNRPTLVLTCQPLVPWNVSVSSRHATPADLEAAGWVRRDGLDSLIAFARQLREREDWGQSCAECGAQWMIGAQIDKASDLIEPYRVRARDAEARVTELEATDAEHCHDFQTIAHALGILDELPDQARVLQRIGELESKAQRLADRIGYKPRGPRPATAWELLESVVDNALAQWANDIVDLHGLRATVKATRAELQHEQKVSDTYVATIHKLGDERAELEAAIKATRVERNEDDRCVWRSGWYAASVGHAASANPYLEPVPPGELEGES